MKNITIPINVPSDILLTLNKSEKELKSHFQTKIAIVLFQEGKLTIGKAIELSGLSRYEFEKELSKNNIPIFESDKDQIISDLDKLRDL